MSMPRFTFALALSTLALCAGAPHVATAQGLGSLFSCDAPGSGNTAGAVVGGLVGALAGSQVSKNERTLGAVIGAGIGAAIGNNIGCRMDRKAQQDARAAFERALETGRAQTWSDPQTGASGRIEVIGPGYRSAQGGTTYSGRWRFADGVEPAVRVSSQGGPHLAPGRVNVRAAPNTQAPVVDRLRPGETFEVAGAAAGGWLAIVEDGLIQGYVSRSVVRPADGSGDGDCRLVQQTIREPGVSPVSERYNACREPGGGWRLSAA
ncbi:MAG: glycine zipper domain-containing protein [Pseudomonadota bacterium]